jgi:dephospho-CoA kinase
MGESKDRRADTRILVGGGIGSGKSRAGLRFAELGANVVEADGLGHEVLYRDGGAFEAAVRRWPEVLVNRHLDRRALAGIVFNDPAQLAELEALTHPAIIERIGAIAAGSGDLVVEIPVIVNIPGTWTKVFVDADMETRVRRAVARGSSEEDVRRRMANQVSRADWLRWADYVMDNNGSVEDLERQIDALWYELLNPDVGQRA